MLAERIPTSNALCFRRRKGLGAFLVILELLTCLIFSSCAPALSPGTLLREMEDGQEPLIVDVRTVGEYERGHVPGAIRIPFYAIGSGLSGIGYSKTEPIVLYCEHGPRSGIAEMWLKISGYQKIYHLDGQMKAWREREMPIEVVQHR